ncbi:MAG: carboxypeptidase-like regulatory domain-containing protein, partial [Lutibacter sp.]
MLKKISICIFLISCSIVFSQNTGTIKGKIIDKQTRANLPFVNVIVIGSTVGAITDENGFFVIKNVPLGYEKVQASFIGYSTFISDDYL